MHIVIAVITAVAGLIWALNRLQDSGVNLNAFNPFYWWRRRQWQQKYGTKPLHQLDNPMDAAAALLVAMAELKGAVSSDAKQRVVATFQNEFSLDERESLELYASSSYLLRDVANVPAEVGNILKPSVEKLSDQHKVSLINMMAQTSSLDGVATTDQQQLLTNLQRYFQGLDKKSKSWPAGK